MRHPDPLCRLDGLRREGSARAYRREYAFAVGSFLAASVSVRRAGVVLEHILILCHLHAEIAATINVARVVCLLDPKRLRN